MKTNETVLQYARNWKRYFDNSVIFFVMHFYFLYFWLLFLESHRVISQLIDALIVIGQIEYNNSELQEMLISTVFKVSCILFIF